MEHLMEIYEVGDMSPWGHGPEIGKVNADPTFQRMESFPGAYLKEYYPQIDYFKSCEVVR
jgi:hypothetical protein